MTREQFYTYQEQTLDAFIKTVAKNKSIDILREYARQADRETPLSELSPSDIGKSASVTDSYRLYSRPYRVCNYVIQVSDPVIGEVLQYLTPQRREVILLYYFLDYSDAEIGRLLRIDNTTAQYRRRSALKQLKKLVEDMQNE